MTTSLSPTPQFHPELGMSFDEFDVEANQLGYVGPMIAPVIETNRSSGTYYVTPLESLLINADDKRNSDGTYNQVRGKVTKETFSTTEHGIEERVDDRNAAILRQDLGYDAEGMAARRCRDVILANHNKRVLDLVDAVANTTAVATNWEDHANATPVDNILDAKIAVRDRCGVLPNALAVDWEIFEHLINCNQIIERLKYQNYQDARPGEISKQALAAALNVDVVAVSGGVFNTKGMGEAAALDSMWTKDNALLYRYDASPDTEKPRFANTFHWGEDGSTMGRSFEMYYSPDKRGEVVRCRMDSEEKLIYETAAQLLTGVAA